MKDIRSSSYIVVYDGEFHQPIILTAAALSLTSQFFGKTKKISIIQQKCSEFKRCHVTKATLIKLLTYKDLYNVQPFLVSIDVTSAR